MSLLATLFNFRSRDATGFYPLQSADSKEYLFWHRLESQASICNSIARLFMKTSRSSRYRPQYHPCQIRGNGSRFRLRLFQT